MASALTVNPYSNQVQTHVASSSYARSPPPSPPAEGSAPKRTLPSIHSLIGMAESPRSSTVEPERRSRHRTDSSNRSPEHGMRVSRDVADNATRDLPPSPIKRSVLNTDGSLQSPSSVSNHSSTSGAHYTASAINNMEPHQQRQPAPHASMEAYPMPRQPSQSPYAMSPYASSPGAMSSYSYPSPGHIPGTPSTMYYQRPLPATFPPPNLPNGPPIASDSHNASPIDQTNPWQHHHYISPSSSAAFAGQSQDRYICQTCNKAFSRPSSLRIHSHSHTGEKPFKCPHSGCGKAFSVRSNMKRHERGCHGGGSPSSS